MSAETNETSTHRPTTGDDRVDALESKLDVALDRIDELEDTVEEQEQEIADLREELDSRAPLRWEGESPADIEVEHQDGWAYPIGSSIASRAAEDVVDEMRDDVDRILSDDPNTGVLGSLREELEGEKKERSTRDARLKHRIAAIADAADVDVDDSDLVGDDKIQRAMREGAEAVEPTVYTVHERAVSMLRNLDDVGRFTNDNTYGKRFSVKTSQAKSHFRQARNERLTSTEVKRVFTKIQDWAESSPRQVDIETGGSGENRMAIQTEVDQ